MPRQKKNSDAAARSSQLCLSCGMCCLGIFFFQENDPRQFGLELEKSARDDPPYPLTCPLYHNSACLIYDDPRRPSICRACQCQLLIKLLADEISLESGRQIVREIKTLLGAIKKRMPSLDKSRPFFFLVGEFWKLHQKDHSSAHRPDGPLLMDIAAVKSLVHRYILPFEGLDK